MVDLMCRLLTFCQCFFSRDTRKFMARRMFSISCSSVMSTLPTCGTTFVQMRTVISYFHFQLTATLRHNTFFIWNLMVAFTSFTFCSRSSE